MAKQKQYIVTGKGKVVIISGPTTVPKKELYDRIFLPAIACIENSLQQKGEE
jgi:hypothetical protein